MVVGAVLSAWAANASAQSRSTVYFRNPGSFTGLEGPGHTFRSYSYGLGGLSGGAGDVSNSLLQSAVSGAASYNIARSGGASGSNLPVPSAVTGGVRYSTEVASLIDTNLAGGSSGMPANLAALAASDYIKTLTEGAATKIPQRTEPLTSLVPDAKGPYHDFMAAADKAFREARYADAFHEYRMAGLLAPRDPASLLGQGLSRVATGSYHSAAFSLRKALEYLPELPLVSLKVRGFYGTPQEYEEQILRLQEYADQRTFDPDPQFLLGCFSWFEGDVSGARTALDKSLSLARQGGTAAEETNAAVVEAIQAFWRGMTASGKVSGSLGASTEDAATSQPAGGNPPPPGENRDQKPPSRL
ncbi:MAG TPA: hypothetical protein PK082_10730 [Phycisphaerae bacterium]|nr:hypothetical protein [Phycisphaerae bacterium]